MVETNVADLTAYVGTLGDDVGVRGFVDEIIISDVDEWVLKNTVDNLQDVLNATVIAESDDKTAAISADFSIASSTMIPVKENILKKVPNALTIV